MSYTPASRYHYTATELRTSIVLFLLMLIGVGCNENKTNPAQSKELTSDKSSAVFAKVPSEETGILFNNHIREDLSSLENLFNFDYFYNGAGTGVADLNNDGLLDIFFCGNQVPNKLYFNKGDLQFEDVSETAGINEGKQWANGVTFLDINSDGWLDIYVSQGGPKQRLFRKNLLYVNQQDGSFREAAETYGLADMGISTQSAFFDYDRDGDLDCIVMNENEYYGVDPVSLKALIEKNPDAPYFNSSHLYRNDGGTFTDISKEAGIERPIFGLGLSISDINTDGWPDIYIASDYYLPDALFINQGNGTFRDEIKTYTQQISYYGMGVDVADINNDALQDIFVLDMASSDHYRSKTLMASMNTSRFDYLVNTAGYHYQYMYNSLQLNNGQNHFSNIAQLTGVANTDWSWSVLMSDFDLDADKDIYVTNGYRRYALDNDLQQRVFQAKQQYKGNVPLAVKEELYRSMPSEKLPNLLFENHGSLEFTENGNQWGLGDLSFSNGAAMGDLDNDGDIDLVVNNMDENAFIYKNQSREKEKGNYLKIIPEGPVSEGLPKVTVFQKGVPQFIEVRRVRGYMSAHEPIAHFGLGKAEEADSILVEWAGGKSNRIRNVRANQTLRVAFADAGTTLPTKQPEEKYLFTSQPASSIGLKVAHQENPYDDFAKEILLPYKQSTYGPYFSQADVNADGITDLFMGGASGQTASLFLGTANGFRKTAMPAFDADKAYEDMESVFFDLDSDGDLDLYVVSGGNEFEQGSSLYQDRVYLNDGAGSFSKAEDVLPATAAFSGKAVAAIDFDQDGDTDLIVGNRILAQSYPRSAPSFLLENEDGKLRDATAEKAPGLQDFGIINDLLVTDFDGDGRKDILAVGEWTSVGFFRNTATGLQLADSEALGVAEKGWWYSITQTDANADGKPDYILGNAGQNIKFSASPEKPFKVFANDFDKNGTNDIVLSKKYQGEYVPVRGRECSSQQMPFIAEKFPSYSEFASASLKDVYGSELDASYEKEVNTLSSVLLINLGSGQFEVRRLPVEAQMIPIFAGISKDLNGDGFEDLILAGNIYETEVETPRLDALSGVVLLSDGKGRYSALPRTDSGLYMKGNIKSLKSIETGSDYMILAGVNNSEPQVYRWQLNN
ncbi:VCBS repeat-containing protein [Robiginitalea sp. IMCC44478]|uniref:VCBS repeat-containing protein n=1 Tax=Robiginitalea sp. IMCC44478 TaxID=3459122 RepID=UPI004042A194